MKQGPHSEKLMCHFKFCYVSLLFGACGSSLQMIFVFRIAVFSDQRETGQRATHQPDILQ